MCVDYFTICRIFIHVAPMTPRTDFAWTDGNDAENHDWFRLCGTNRPKCAECPSINKFYSTSLLIMPFSDRKSCQNSEWWGFLSWRGAQGIICLRGVGGVSRRIIGNLIWNWFVIKIVKGCRPPPPSDLRMTFFRFKWGGFFLHNIHIYLKIY